MKTTKLLLFTLLVAVSLANTACSDDDDSMSASEVISNIGVLDAKTGLRLKSIYHRSYTDVDVDYDEKGKVETVKIYGDDAIFRFSGNKLIYEKDYLDGTQSMDLSFNGAGYVSSISYSEVDDGDRYTEKLSMSYSGEHLTKVTYSFSEQDSYGSREDGDGTFTLNWSDGMLKSCDDSNKSKDEYGTYNWKCKYTYGYERNDNRNKYAQYPVCMKEMFIDGPFEDLYFLAYIGLLGKGPSYLPVEGKWKEVEIDNDGEKYEDDDEESYSYSFNSDGTISTENVDGANYYYTYTIGNDDYGVKLKSPSNLNLRKPGMRLSRKERIKNRRTRRAK